MSRFRGTVRSSVLSTLVIFCVTLLLEVAEGRAQAPAGAAINLFDLQKHVTSREAVSIPLVRHLTLEQAQQTAAQANDLMTRLGQFSVEAAKQHRLAATADYFPKVNVLAWNLHFNKFLGQEITVVRPLLGTTTTVGVPLLGQDQTVAAFTVTQPITPLFKVRQAVEIARADETIAQAKAGMPVAARSAVEQKYFELAIAQTQTALVQASVRRTQVEREAAVTGPAAPNVADTDAEAAELRRLADKVRVLTIALNELLGWPAETALQLAPPEPLVERISLQDAQGRALAANPEIIEAEQTLKKAQAAQALSKLDYIPDLAVLGGFVYQSNSIPLLPKDFAFVGVLGSYNIFDSGRREHSLRERTAQVHMAETALQLTRAKVAAAVRTSYSALTESRVLSERAQHQEPVVRAVDAKYVPIDDEPTRASLQQLQLDYQHRQAFAELKALMGED